jgi:hypothetical protein
MAAMSSKAESESLEARMNEHLSKVQRALERLDVAQQSSSSIVQEMPHLQREMTGRMGELEQRLASELSDLTQTLGTRMSSAESDLRNKASKTELNKLHVNVEDRPRRDEVETLQSLVNKVRDEAIDRIDGIGERTFNMRKELDGNLDRMTTASEMLQQRIEQRMAGLEQDAAQVSGFLSKADRQLGSKVSSDELVRATTAFSEQLQETRNVLQAQMDVVRNRAERSIDDFQRVVLKMDSVAMRAELEPVAQASRKLQTDLIELTSEVATKAAEVSRSPAPLTERLGTAQAAPRPHCHRRARLNHHRCHPYPSPPPPLAPVLPLPVPTRRTMSPPS